MKNDEIRDPVFREAVEAIDAGDVPALEQLLAAHPGLLHDPLDFPEEGYFKNPYLLWFVADNPIRHEKLPANIVQVADTIIQAAKREGVQNLPFQIDYALALAATGRIPRECGVQIALLDLFIGEGARPGNGIGALAHGNIAAAEHLLERGGNLTLAAAVCLERNEAVPRLAKEAGAADLQLALVAAAFFGKADKIQWLLGLGVHPDTYLDPQQAHGFHSHATALHQAVYSGSLDAVKTLVEAGARRDLPDRCYQATPLDWAIYMQTEVQEAAMLKKYKAIETYLRNIP